LACCGRSQYNLRRSCTNKEIKSDYSAKNRLAEGGGKPGDHTATDPGRYLTREDGVKAKAVLFQTISHQQSENALKLSIPLYPTLLAIVLVNYNPNLKSLLLIKHSYRLERFKIAGG